ncbi:phosphatase PAP2 family protein [Streptomyces sp. ISL-100]|uniref:phosphatase PAP2 family protein n=1 Tax=Streptomyces sp. ISL-100 TaxID=2819173 RepID=UPI001BE81BC1|nr:phosphatase PAP2 family protein [Streptomyces sp. ISL-100]MBT2399241.1 phosphatase PAP2 family protein [Streptomyces sp. ISL-100]
MRETPRSQGTAGGSRSRHPLPRPGRAVAHTTGASGSGTPHRSDRRPSHTPRGARHTGPGGCPGTTPPVPGQPAFLFAAFAPLALFGLLFALITWQVAAHGPLRRADERIGRAVVGHGPTGLTEFLADLGNMAVALPVLAAAVAYTLWRGGRAPAAAAVPSMAAVPALVAPVKSWIARPGPLTQETGYYPSGHAATAAVAYCGAALLVSVYVRHHRWWPPLLALVLTLATGAGLILRGYHWPLDVVGSWCLCLPSLVLVSHRLPARYRPPPRASRAPAAPDQ